MHKWWSNVKKIAGLTPKSSPCAIIYNRQSSDNDLANLWNDKFVAVGNTLPPFSWVPLESDDIPSDFHISADDTVKALKSIKPHSAAGPDEIPSWFLSENASFLCHLLASIFNASIRGFIPSLWHHYDIDIHATQMVRSNGQSWCSPAYLYVGLFQSF